MIDRVMNLPLELVMVNYLQLKIKCFLNKYITIVFTYQKAKSTVEEAMLYFILSDIQANLVRPAISLPSNDIFKVFLHLCEHFLSQSNV